MCLKFQKDYGGRKKMSKLLPTLLMVILLVIVGAFTALSFIDVSIEQTLVEKTISYQDYKAKFQS